MTGGRLQTNKYLMQSCINVLHHNVLFYQTPVQIYSCSIIYIYIYHHENIEKYQNLIITLPCYHLHLSSQQLCTNSTAVCIAYQHCNKLVCLLELENLIFVSIKTTNFNISGKKFILCKENWYRIVLIDFELSN